MSYYLPAPTTGPRQRPTVVTMASYLLYAVAALVVVGGVVSLSTLGAVTDAMRDAYAGLPNGADLQSFTKGVLIVSVVVNLLEAALFVVLGVFVAKGNNGMRITTWVIAGLGVLCFGCGAASGGLTSSLRTSTSDAQRAATVRVEDAIPGWAHATSIALSVINLLLLIAVIVLLTLAPANAFFRKQPLPQPGYPAYPGYPGGSPGMAAPPMSPYPVAPPSAPPRWPVSPPAPGAPPVPPNDPPTWGRPPS